MVDDVGPEDLERGEGPAEQGGQPYQSLYRRYRPQRFADVRGQEHVTRALLNSVRDGRVAHAYLFSGPRGTGKTSTARILAMALNCENPQDGEPCGVCSSCVAIRRGTSLDVHELDAASNRKLDEMRDLLSRVALGTSGRWKVYIVDEVHQLTSDAASALLKTLEEPPGHVIFVLATTDPQKVMPTIRSRTQHFEFHLLGSDVLSGLLSDINTKAGLGVAPEAIDLVVRRGHGSARDALSVLDQVAAAGTVDDETAVVADIVEALADRDAGRVLMAVAECMSAGRDPRRLATDLLEHLRNGFLASQARGLVLLSDDAAAEAEGQARRLGLAALVRAMEIIGQASTDMRESVDPRVALEVALVRVASPAADHQPAALLARIEQLEHRLAEASPLPPRVTVPVAPPAVPAAPVDLPPARVAVPAAPVDLPPARVAVPAAPPTGPAEPTGRPPRVPTPSPARLGDPPPLPRPSLSRPRAAPAPAARSAAAPGPTGPTGPRGNGSSSAPTGASEIGGRGEVSVGAIGNGELPTRDELTKAWGDTVLPSLPARMKAYLALGRFTAVDQSGAVYALPDGGLLGRAGTVRHDFEAALAAHFGRNVPVRLVLDQPASGGSVAPAGGAPPPVEPPPAEEAADDPSDYVLAEMEDVGAAIVSPEQRLLDAFPGAEEVTP